MPEQDFYIKTDAGEGKATIKSYMAVDGIQFPAEVEAEGGGQKMTIKTTKSGY